MDNVQEKIVTCYVAPSSENIKLDKGIKICHVTSIAIGHAQDKVALIMEAVYTSETSTSTRPQGAISQNLRVRNVENSDGNAQHICNGRSVWDAVGDTTPLTVTVGCKGVKSVRINSTQPAKHVIFIQLT
jgi:hypothetical protein